jgi:hypothetical protein
MRLPADGRRTGGGRATDGRRTGDKTAAGWKKRFGCHKQAWTFVRRHLFRLPEFFFDYRMVELYLKI